MALVLFFLPFSYGFHFYAPASSQFCFKEDILSETLALITLKSEAEIEFLVIDPENAKLYLSKNVVHKFSFSAFSSGVYQFCVNNQDSSLVKLDVDFKTGIQAKDYSGIANVKKLKDVELKLRKLEDKTKEIHKKIQFIREREEEMRNTNLTIHDRVICYSICTMTILMVLAFVQVMYSKRFFRAKKMI